MTVYSLIYIQEINTLDSYIICIADVYGKTAEAINITYSYNIMARIFYTCHVIFIFMALLLYLIFQFY